MLLWRYLRDRQMQGLKIRRQQPIGRYVVDFPCFEKKIIIEVDGGNTRYKQRKIGKEINGLEVRDSKFSDFGIMKY
jgi:very-short-patch-repair endonuclease